MRFASILRNAFIVSVTTKIATALLGVLGSVLLTRYLGLSLRGEYAYIYAVNGLAMVIFCLGLHQAYPFFKRQQYPLLKERFITLAWLVFVVYSILSAIVIFALHRNCTIVIIAALTPISILSYQLNYVLMIERINQRNITVIINTVVNILLYAVLFFTTKSNIVYLAIIILSKDAIDIVVYSVLLKTKPSWRYFHLSLLKEFTHFGIYPMLSLLMMTCNYRIAVVLLKLHVDYAQIGLYSIGLGLAERVWLLPDAFKEVLLSRLAKNGTTREMLIVLKLSTYACCVVVILALIFGRSLIVFLYGQDFAQAYNVTVVLFAGVIGMVFYKIIEVYHIVHGRQKLNFFFLLVAVVIGVVLNLLLIPRYGIVGSAFSSVGSYTISGVLFIWSLLHFERVPFWDMIILTTDDVCAIKGYLGKYRSSVLVRPITSPVNDR